MPDLKVFEGGDDGGAFRHKQIATQYFVDFVRETVRFLSGGGSPHRIAQSSFLYFEHCAEHEVNFAAAIEAACSRIREQQSTPPGGQLPPLNSEENIVLAALGIVTERLADDEFASTRLSKKFRQMRSAISVIDLEREVRAQELADRRRQARGSGDVKGPSKPLKKRTPRGRGSTT